MPLIIPIFIPHEGCPHRCLFCNQHIISSQNQPPITAAEVASTICAWLRLAKPERRIPAQVAFYGGSFTALSVGRQTELLAAVQPFLCQGTVQSIRLSTRPDALDANGLALLVSHGVSAVELGVQSCDDQVLRQAGRGHSYADSLHASRLIREQGLQLGWQLMPGLPGEDVYSLRRTVAATIQACPDCVRIYPTLVLRGSGLEGLYNQGRYKPLGLRRAVTLAAFMKKRFDDHGIGVIRMGLQGSATLEKELVAGPWHPAFGELVKARLMLRQTLRKLMQASAAAPVVLVINDRDQSIFRGPGLINLRRLQELGLSERFILHLDPNQPRQTVVLGEP